MGQRGWRIHLSLSSDCTPPPRWLFLWRTIPSNKLNVSPKVGPLPAAQLDNTSAARTGSRRCRIGGGWGKLTVDQCVFHALTSPFSQLHATVETFPGSSVHSDIILQNWFLTHLRVETGVYGHPMRIIVQAFSHLALHWPPPFQRSRRIKGHQPSAT